MGAPPPRPAFPFFLFAAATAHVGDSASSAPTPAMSLEDIDRDLNVRDFDLKTGRRNFKSGFSSLGGEVPNLCRSTFFILPPKKTKRQQAKGQINATEPTPKRVQPRPRRKWEET